MSGSRLLSSPRSFLFSAGSARPASGIRLGFKTVSGNADHGEIICDSNFFMDVTDIRDRRIMITFHNRSQLPCTISDIYFVDAEVFTISIQNVRNHHSTLAPECSVDLTTAQRQVAPEPYHNSSTYQVARQNTDDNDGMPDGIQPNESLGIVFDLQAGVTLADIIGALSNGILNVSLKLLGVAQGTGGVLINDSTLGLSPR